MPFRFPLQAVLRSRESFERRERQRLQIISRDVFKAQQQWERAKVERANTLSGLQQKLRKGSTAGELQFELFCDRARVRRITAWRERLSGLKELQRRQIEIYRHTQQQRKIMENLRDRQHAAYQLVQNRRTQQQMDDRYLITHAGQYSEPQP
jgi:flagellar export protein FliJ